MAATEEGTPEAAAAAEAVLEELGLEPDTPEANEALENMAIPNTEESEIAIEAVEDVQEEEEADLKADAID